MTTREEARKIINDLFEEEALAIGGLVALHRPEDDFIWKLVRSLDAIRRRALKRLTASHRGSPASTARVDLAPHPAIQQFLKNLHRR